MCCMPSCRLRRLDAPLASGTRQKGYDYDVWILNNNQSLGPRLYGEGLLISFPFWCPQRCPVQHLHNMPLSSPFRRRTYVGTPSVNGERLSATSALLLWALPDYMLGWCNCLPVVPPHLSLGACSGQSGIEATVSFYTGVRTILLENIRVTTCKGII